MIVPPLGMGFGGVACACGAEGGVGDVVDVGGILGGCLASGGVGRLGSSVLGVDMHPPILGDYNREVKGLSLFANRPSCLESGLGDGQESVERARVLYRVRVEAGRDLVGDWAY